MNLDDFRAGVAVKMVALGDLIGEYGGLIQTGPFGSQLHQRDYTDHGVPVVMPKDIRAGRIDESTVARVSEHKARELARHYALRHTPFINTDVVVPGLNRNWRTARRYYGRMRTSCRSSIGSIPCSRSRDG